MMENAVRNSVIRFFLLWLIQVFILKQIQWGWGGEIYLQVFLYPLFIILLPLRTPRTLTVFLAFILGCAIDWLYESPGMHAGALLFTAVLRSVVLNILEPRESYSVKSNPTKISLGSTWFFQYAATLLFIHTFFYFSLEAFTFVFLKTIILKVFFSWLASLFVLMAVVYTTNPEA